MKILAIRGANLASLEGEFALDLAEGPLARAGVFAICGPTGAGKSTLLDAMCLALYDTAPRLDASSRVRVGREEDADARLTTSDPRAILRKGAGSGYAEVDFLGADGRRYRARWEVRRARGKAGGKLQATVMSLVDLELDAPLAGSRKTDVRQAIEERLGLSFDQFRRSVLLAQGDFAAFLDADAKERAGLLERMTGTEIYGVISMEAHARAVGARRSLELSLARQEQLAVLSEDARAVHEEKARALEIQHLVDQRRGRDAQRAVDWHAQLEALRREEALALADHQQIERQLVVWETRRQELALYASALPVQAWLDAADRLRRARSSKAAELTQAALDRDAAALHAREAEQAQRAASAAAQEAERALEEAGPSLGRARLLDQSIEVERARLAALEAKQRVAQEALHAARARVTEREARFARLREEELRSREWLASHAALEPIARRWDRNEERLARAVELSSEVKALAEARAAALEAHRAADARAAERSASAASASAASALAEERWKEALALASSAPSEALAEERTRWVDRRSALQTMIGVAELAQSAYDAARRQRALGDRASEGARRAAAEAEVASRERDSARIELAEAARARDLLRATLDLAAHRVELREGEACPLCGSHDHPFAREAPALEGALLAQDARMEELGERASALERRLADLLRAAEAQREAEQAAELEASSWSAELAAHRVRYAEAARSLGAGSSTASASEVDPASPPSAGAKGIDARARPRAEEEPDVTGAQPSAADDPDLAAARSRALTSSDGRPRGALREDEVAWPSELPSAPARGLLDCTPDWGPLFAATAGEADGPLLDQAARRALVAACDDAARVLAELDAEERARRDRERDAERLRGLCDRAREAAAQASREATAAGDLREERGRDAERAGRALADREGRLEALAAELADALAPWPRWRERLREDGEALAAEVRRDVAAWRARDEACAAAAGQRALLAPSLEAARTEDASAARLERDAASDVAAARASLAEQAQLRAALLGGASASEHERALREARDGARERRERALESASAAQRAEAEKAARAARAIEAHEEAERDAALAEARLAEALIAIGLDEEGARARLGRDRQEIERWRAELARLDEARGRQAAVLAERARKREEHEALEPPSLDAAQAREAVIQADKAGAATRELLMAERARLMRDDEQRNEARALAEELERQRAEVALWESLSEIVGSANGSRLRVFAQSLTLEILLEHANLHLRELAPRYALARVPGEDLALMVIDHEMGDEVRAVSSLSGGEAFLVALGMALGLASLSSQRARIDSLFIDEGFGALDPPSLDLVLSTLDLLQASGRQVGLISHVPTIAERFDTRVSVVAAGPARSRVELVEGFA